MPPEINSYAPPPTSCGAASATNDFLARLGGDEFGTILTRTPADIAPVIVDRLTRVLDRAGTCASVGWSPLLPNGTVATAVELADRAMHDEKNERTNRGPRT